MWHRGNSEIGKVCYLTIQENLVEAGKSQRRPGLHVDCPGTVKLRKVGGKKEGGGRAAAAASKGALTSEGLEGKGSAKRWRDHHWGLGECYFIPPQPHAEGLDPKAYMRSFIISGGIFMASNVDESCRAWNCKIAPEEEEEEEEEEVEELLMRRSEVGKT